MTASLAHIALGSNLGVREGHLRFALGRIARLPRTVLATSSRFVETNAVGGPEQPAYLNAAATVRTEMSAHELLGCLLAIERERGRTRSAEQRWGPRTLDLDLLLFGDLIVDEPGLTIPHPRMHTRGFVLEPLAEIAGRARIPTLGCTVEEALRALRSPDAGIRR